MTEPRFLGIKGSVFAERLEHHVYVCLYRLHARNYCPRLALGGRKLPWCRQQFKVLCERGSFVVEPAELTRTVYPCRLAMYP